MSGLRCMLTHPSAHASTLSSTISSIAQQWVVHTESLGGKFNLLGVRPARVGHLFRPPANTALSNHCDSSLLWGPREGGFMGLCGHFGYSPLWRA